MFEQRRDNPNPKPIVNILEESQNPFGSYSMNDDISLVLKTIFTQSRTDANIHYILLTQRLNDTSAQIVERLRPLIGYTLGDNALIKIRRQLPKPIRSVPQTLKPGIFLYPSAYNGNLEDALLKSPDYKPRGKSFRLNPNMYEKPKPKPKPLSLTRRLKGMLELLFTAKPLNMPLSAKDTEDTDEDLDTEHTLLAENENEETESLYFP